MTTLLLTENFPPVVGGSSRWLWELYRRMPRSALVVVAGAHAGDGEFDRTHDLRMHRLPLSFPDLGLLSLDGWTRYRRATRAVQEIVRSEPVRRIHCGRLLPEAWVALSSGVPYACFVHGEELATARTSRQLTWMGSRALARAEFVIANSDHTAGILRTGWNAEPERVRVLRPGVDARRFVPAPRDERARAQLGWSGRRVVLTASRLQKRKGHDRMIEAIGLLRDRFPDLLYAVVGAGEERVALGEQVRREAMADHVVFHGALDDAALLGAYQQCDVFALPNRDVDGDFEGFGMVLLEAQACARAVIAGRSGGTAEAMRADDTGLIVDCADAGELARAVATLLAGEEQRARMGERGRRWVEQEFDFDARIAEAQRVLEIGPAR